MQLETLKKERMGGAFRYEPFKRQLDTGELFLHCRGLKLIPRRALKPGGVITVRRNKKTARMFDSLFALGRVILD